MSLAILESIAAAGEVSIQDKITRLEVEMRKHEQLEIEPVHRFAKGLYAREITIPAGTLLTGKVHKEQHMNVISKGRITVLTENGLETISAPATIVSPPGTKRIGYAHEETVWTTIHATEETDVAAVERILVYSEEELLAIEEASKCLS